MEMKILNQFVLHCNHYKLKHKHQVNILDHNLDSLKIDQINQHQFIGNVLYHNKQMFKDILKSQISRAEFSL